jgi:hypothetical protein
MGKADLGVEDPPDPTFFTRFFPTQDTDEHECKQDNVGEKGGQDANLGVLCIYNPTIDSSPVPAGCGCTCEYTSEDY